jgi:arylsulfatase A-like enzyme
MHTRRLPAFLTIRMAGLSTVLGVAALLGLVCGTAQAQPQKPNILVIFGDDIGQSNLSAYTFGPMGYKTPNIDRLAKEGMLFTDYYAEQSCTAGRSTFITGQATLRTGLSKVGIPGATVGLQPRDATIAELLKPLGYATGQFGKNHLGDRDEYLRPTTASTSSSAISTTSTPRRTPSNGRIPPSRTSRASRENLARAAS